MGDVVELDVVLVVGKLYRKTRQELGFCKGRSVCCGRLGWGGGRGEKLVYVGSTWM